MWNATLKGKSKIKYLKCSNIMMELSVELRRKTVEKCLQKKTWEEAVHFHSYENEENQNNSGNLNQTSGAFSGVRSGDAERCPVDNKNDVSRAKLVYQWKKKFFYVIIIVFTYKLVGITQQHILSGFHDYLTGFSDHADFIRDFWTRLIKELLSY